MTTRAFDVFLHDGLVGHLVDDEREITFRFVDAYRTLARRPVLGQCFEDDLDRDHAGKRGELPPFFANLVPEEGLRHLVAKATGAEVSDDLSILEAVGLDLPGAVQLRPSLALEDIPDRADTAPDEGAGDHLAPGGDLRFSLTGVQLKFSAVRDADKLALPAKGRYGAWIVKLEGDRFPGLVDNEYSTLMWAGASGFEVPECELVTADDLSGPLRDHVEHRARGLAVRRYDRDGARRIHQEDFAQVMNLPPRLKYEHIKYEQLAYFVRVTSGEDGYEEFLRRLAFVVASGNADAHLKNWSLIYPDGVRCGLAPLYDQVSTVAWLRSHRQLGLEQLALKLAGVKKFGSIDARAFERLAERAHAPAKRTVDVVRETLAVTAAAFRSLRGSLPMPAEHIVALDEHWRRVPLLREHDIGA